MVAGCLPKFETHFIVRQSRHALGMTQGQALLAEGIAMEVTRSGPWEWLWDSIGAPYTPISVVDSEP